METALKNTGRQRQKIPAPPVLPELSAGSIIWTADSQQQQMEPIVFLIIVKLRDT